MLASAYHRAYGIGKNTVYLFILFFEILHDAGKGSAASGAGNKIVYLTIHLVVYLRTCGLIVSQRIGRITKLCQRDGSGNVFYDLLGLSFGAEHSFFS